MLFSRIAAGIEPKLIAPPNSFRKRICYTEAVSQVLKRNELSLRCVFGGLCLACERRQRKMGVKGSGALIDLATFMASCRKLELLGPDLAERGAVLSFCWSRMAVRDISSEKGARRMSHLPFEGWLEALCHLAALKAIPTDAQIEESLDEHAGAHLSRLRSEQGKEFRNLLARGANKWGDDQLSQPFDRAVAHLLAIITHAIETDVQGSGSVGDSSRRATAVSYRRSELMTERKAVLRWRKLGFWPKVGEEVRSPALSRALAGGELEFTRQEMDGFALTGALQSNSYIVVEAECFDSSAPERALGGCCFRPGPPPEHNAPVISREQVDKWLALHRLMDSAK